MGSVVPTTNCGILLFDELCHTRGSEWPIETCRILSGILKTEAC